MKIITKKKAIKYIETQIETLKVEDFKDKYSAFESVYNQMSVFHDLGILNQDELDILWNKLRNKTTDDKRKYYPKVEVEYIDYTPIIETE
jgi:hypothetical protein